MNENIKGLWQTVFGGDGPGMKHVAHTTVADYKAGINSTDSSIVAAMKIYIQGLGDGLEWANTGLEEQLYCEPSKLVLELANYIQIIDHQIEANVAAGPPEKVEEMSLGLILLTGLKSTFPCGPK